MTITIANKLMKNQTKQCVECKSEYFVKSSKMPELCPECSHHLYGYENCEHQFTNGRCVKCYWNGSKSEYLKL